jgi:hypothetical protein
MCLIESVLNTVAITKRAAKILASVLFPEPEVPLRRIIKGIRFSIMSPAIKKFSK